MTLSLSRHPTWFNLVPRAYCLSDRKKSKIKASEKNLNKSKKIKSSVLAVQQKIFHVESVYNFNAYS